MPPFSIAPPPRVDPFGYANANAVRKILETIGQGERQRQDQLLQGNILAAISQGGEPSEVMTNIASIISQRQPQYDTGFQGVIQKIASRFAPPSSFDNVMMGPLLKTALAPRKKAQPDFEPTREQTGFDRDARTVINEKKPEPTRQAAEDRLKRNPRVNQALVRSAISDKRFLEITKGTKLKKKIGILDKAYGPKAYKKALKSAIRDGLSEGFTAESTEQVFNNWWDEQVTKTGGVFKEFLPRQGASQGTQEISGTDVRLQSAPDVRLDSIWGKLSTTQKNQILTQLDQDPQGTDTIITNVLARVKGAGS